MILIELTILYVSIETKRNFCYNSTILLIGYPREMERAVPEASVMRQFWRNLRMDQVRGTVEHRADQRPKHARHALLLVARWTDGAHLLPGNLIP